LFLIHWKYKEGEVPALAFDRNLWEIWTGDPYFGTYSRLVAACGSESEALLRAAALGKKPWLKTREDDRGEAWRLEDLG